MADDRKKQIATRRRTAAIRKWFSDAELAQDMPECAPTIIDDICTAMVEGGHSLSKICKDKLVPDAPSLSMLFVWRRLDPRINDAISAARQAQAETKWTELGEKIETELDAAAELGDKHTIQAADKKMTLLFRHAQFEVSKLIPAIYGDRVEKMVANGLDPKTGMPRDPNAAGKDGVALRPAVLEIPSKSREKPGSDSPVSKKSDQTEEVTVIDIPAKRRTG